VSIFDTYRVVYTTSEGIQQPGGLFDARDLAMARFDFLLAKHSIDGTFPGRLRVISEKVWIESQAVKA